MVDATVARVGSAVVCLVRGVNVGGRGKLPMATLRQVAADLGFTGATTYLQSGNLVLPDPPEGLDVAAALEAGLGDVGFSTTVMSRTAAAWAAVVAANPFPRAAVDGTRVHVAFVSEPVGDAFDDVDTSRFDPERVRIVNGPRSTEVYLSLPGGIGRSRLAAHLGRGALEPATIRNWNTVTALHDLVAE